MAAEFEQNERAAERGAPEAETLRRAHFLRLKEDAAGEGRVFVPRRNPLWELRYGDRDYTVNGRYVVNPSKRLPEQDSPFAEAYEVRDLKADAGESAEHASSLYALVWLPGCYARLETLNRLHGMEVPHLSNALQWQIIPYPAYKRRALTVILRRPYAMTLAEYVKTRGPLDEKSAESKLAVPLLETLGALASAGVVHGCINPSTVTVDPESFQLMIRECVGAPCGYAQSAFYEPLCRVSCEPFAKGEYGRNPDLYALAVTLAFACFGEDFTEGLAPEDVTDLKYQRGAYRMIAEKWRAGRRLSDLLRGALNEHALSAWTVDHAHEWMRGRRFNLLPPKPPGTLHRPVHFMGKKYYTAPHLADVMGRNRTLANRFLGDSESMRWLERSMEDNADSAEKLISFHTRYVPESDDETVTIRRKEEDEPEAVFVFGRNDETLTQFLMALDPEGPVRAPGLTARMTALGTVLAESQRLNRPDLADAAEWMLVSPVFMFWGENQSSHRPEGDEETMFTLRRASGGARSRRPFSRERLLYDLCRGAPCADARCAAVPLMAAEELLLAAERGDIALSLAEDWGAHINAFLISRAELKGPPVLRKLRAFPAFVERADIRNLALAAAVQRALRIRKLPELSSAAFAHLERMAEEIFRGKSIRNDMLRLAKAASDTGYLYMTLEAVCLPKFHIAERAGGRRASEEYRRNAVLILSLNDPYLITRAGKRYGLELSVAVSYLLVAVAAAALTLNLL